MPRDEYRFWRRHIERHLVILKEAVDGCALNVAEGWIICPVHVTEDKHVGTAKVHGHVGVRVRGLQRHENNLFAIEVKRYRFRRGYNRKSGLRIGPGTAGRTRCGRS